MTFLFKLPHCLPYACYLSRCSRRSARKPSRLSRHWQPQMCALLKRRMQ